MRILLRHPALDDQLRVRCDADWNRDVPPRRGTARGAGLEFELPEGPPFRYYKAVKQGASGLKWSQGPNSLALASRPGDTVHYPFFDEAWSCHHCTRHNVPSEFGEEGFDVRVFLPPGYEENTLRHFPVLYMQDGQNLFFPEDAHEGKHWRLPEALEHLAAMNLIRPIIVVGIYPRDRHENYTAPGYERYGRFVVDRLKPWVDQHYRTLPGPADTAVLGSSLGGVVSFYLAWQWPEIFGMAGAMSSTFGYRDDLLQRVLDEAPRDIRIYLDSGWPNDNFEATRSLLAALVTRGWSRGRDVLSLAFPLHAHNEDAWAGRVHLPLQFFFGEHAPRGRASATGT